MAEYLELHPVDPQPRLIRRAAEMLRAGGLIAYPTDSCYALGWHIGDTRSLERVRRIRQADRHHHFTLVCSSLAEIGRFARIETWQFRMLHACLPGPYTFLLPPRARRRAACSTSAGARSACAFRRTRCRGCCSPSSASRS